LVAVCSERLISKMSWGEKILAGFLLRRTAAHGVTENVITQGDIVSQISREGAGGARAGTGTGRVRRRVIQAQVSINMDPRDE
jgi:hypothetical protein